MRAAIAATAIVLSACGTQPSTMATRAAQLTPGVSTRDEAIIPLGRLASELLVAGGVLMSWVENPQPQPAGAKAAQVSGCSCDTAGQGGGAGISFAAAAVATAMVVRGLARRRRRSS